MKINKTCKELFGYKKKFYYDRKGQESEIFFRMPPPNNFVVKVLKVNKTMWVFLNM